MTVGRLHEGLIGRGHQVQLIRPRQKRVDARIRREHDELLTVPGLRLPLYPDLQFGLPARRKLTERWRRARPDIVHIVTEGPLGASALGAARDLRLPTLAGFHTNFHSYSRHYGFGFLHRPIIAYLRRFHNRCHATLAPTLELAQQLESLAFRNVRVLARGVDTRLFTPLQRDLALRRSWGANDDQPVALYVGRLAPEKNLTLAIQAFLALRALRPFARFVLVGDGPLARKLRVRHPDFLFCGVRTGADLAAHYASADIFLFPSLTETFGNVTLEAMASGLAVVAFEYAAAYRHIEHNRSGLLAPLGDADAFIRLARGLGCDLERAHALGRQARTAIEPFGWERIHDQLIETYSSLAK